MREQFFADLQLLHKRCGPWHAVLFTGDFVQRGAAAEFDELQERALDPLWERLSELGPPPVLLGVPGNHDLERPVGKSPRAAVTVLKRPGMFYGDVADEFWRDRKCEYRRVIDRAFANYQSWWSKRPFSAGHAIRDGLLPGDFSTSFKTRGGKRIGVVGLNTTFLQLEKGDYRGRLAWHVQQLNEACGGDGDGWVKQHDICLLMTHQGPEWLDQPSREAYAEINPAGRFAVHLFGHMHEEMIRSGSLGGGQTVRMWQGPSLFGLKEYGNDNMQERSHGYASGSLHYKEGRIFLRHWPREAVYDCVNGWRFVRDEKNCVLQEDGGSLPETITPTRHTTNDETTGGALGDPVERVLAQALANYHRHAQEEWHSRWSEVIEDDES